MKALATIVAAVVFTGCAAQHLDEAGLPTPSPTEQAAIPSADAQAAISAAVAFVCSGQRLLDTPPANLPEVIRATWSRGAADAAVSSTIAELAELGERLSAGSGPTRFRQAALAVRVESFSSSRAEVSVWWVGVLSRSGTAAPQAQWATTTVELLWESDTWKVDKVDTEPGPLPDHSVDAEPLTETEYERRLDGFIDREAAR